MYVFFFCGTPPPYRFVRSPNDSHSLTPGPWNINRRRRLELQRGVADGLEMWSYCVTGKYPPPSFLGIEGLSRTVWCSVVVGPHQRNSKKPVYGTGTEVPSGWQFWCVNRRITVLSEGTGKGPIDKTRCIVRRTLASLWRRNCLGEQGLWSVSAVLWRGCDPWTVITW